MLATDYPIKYSTMKIKIWKKMVSYTVLKSRMNRRHFRKFTAQNTTLVNKWMSGITIITINQPHFLILLLLLNYVQRSAINIISLSKWLLFEIDVIFKFCNFIMVWRYFLKDTMNIKTMGKHFMDDHLSTHIAPPKIC